MFEKIMDNYKVLIIVPFIIALLSLSVIAINGFDYGIDLRGGSQADLELIGSATTVDVENALKTNLHASDIKIMNSDNKKVTIETDTSASALEFTNALDGKAKLATYNTIGPVLSEEANEIIFSDFSPCQHVAANEPAMIVFQVVGRQTADLGTDCCLDIMWMLQC